MTERHEILFFCFFILLSSVLCPLSSDNCFAQEWKELRGDHFIILYNDNDNFIREVLRKAEDCYTRIASDLGYARYSNFWQWDKRVKIIIYPTKNEFLNSTRQPQWSEASASYSKKEISSYSGSHEFLDSILPHEIAHLIFRDFVGFPQGNGLNKEADGIPLWLDEGVAQWQEPAKRQLVKYFIKQLYDDNALLSLDELTQKDIRLAEGTKEAQNFYVQAASLVEFLISRYGTQSFTEFCRQLRDGKSMDDALRLAYSPRVSGLSGLEKQWLDSVASLKITTRKLHGKDGVRTFLRIEE